MQVIRYTKKIFLDLATGQFNPDRWLPDQILQAVFENTKYAQVIYNQCGPYEKWIIWRGLSHWRRFTETVEPPDIDENDVVLMFIRDQYKEGADFSQLKTVTSKIWFPQLIDWLDERIHRLTLIGHLIRIGEKKRAHDLFDIDQLWVPIGKSLPCDPLEAVGIVGINHVMSVSSDPRLIPAIIESGKLALLRRIRAVSFKDQKKLWDLGYLTIAITPLHPKMLDYIPEQILIEEHVDCPAFWQQQWKKKSGELADYIRAGLEEEVFADGTDWQTIFNYSKRPRWVVENIPHSRGDLVCCLQQNPERILPFIKYQDLYRLWDGREVQSWEHLWLYLHHVSQGSWCLDHKKWIDFKPNLQIAFEVFKLIYQFDYILMDLCKWDPGLVKSVLKKALQLVADG